MVYGILAGRIFRTVFQVLPSLLYSRIFLQSGSPFLGRPPIACDLRVNERILRGLGNDTEMRVSDTVVTAPIPSMERSRGLRFTARTKRSSPYGWISTLSFPWK